MNFKRMISAVSAAVMAVSCTYIPSLGSVVAEEDYEEDYEYDPIFVPDFPQEVLDEFMIDWTGLGCNRNVENIEYDSSKSHNKFWYDGGYAMYANQSYIESFCYIGHWHDCKDFIMYQSKEFAYPEYADKLDLKLEMDLHCEIKEMGELKTGPLLELNGGKNELFVIERFTSATDFSDYKKIGSYTSDGNEYKVYKPVDENKDGGTVRYYSVRTSGIITDITTEVDLKRKFTSNISDHLSNLHELTGTDIRLDRYGVLTEGKNGIGNVYTDDRLESSYRTLPEEKLSYDENNEPVVYDYNFVKNLDGYRYSFQTSEADWPMNLLEDGRYEHIVHENNSRMMPSGDGKFHAEVSEGITAGIFAGKEFDGKALVTDHYYNISYKYKVSDDKADARAVVWMNDPYVRVEFLEKSRASELDRRDYAGNIALDGEKYEVYLSPVLDYDVDPLMEVPFDSAYIVHLDDDDVNDKSEIKESSFPVSALIEAAKPLGVESGDLCRIGVCCNTFNSAYTLDILENSITESAPKENGGIYVDVKSNVAVKIEPYSFTALTSGYMHGYENGRFTAVANGGDWSEYNAGRYVEGYKGYTLGPDSNIKAEYKLDNGFEDKYEIGYAVISTTNIQNETIYIIENSKNYNIDYNIFEEDSSTSVLNYLKTYKAGGHEYDLYKYNMEIHGCFAINRYEYYVSVRKDQEEGRILEGSIDLNEHINEIDPELFDNMRVSRFNLIARAHTVSGKLEAQKNDIVFDEKEKVVGDFNGDSCVDSLDIIAARKDLLSMYYSNSSVPKNVDLDQNGKYQIADVVLLQSFVLGKIKEFPDKSGN